MVKLSKFLKPGTDYINEPAEAAAKGYVEFARETGSTYFQTGEHVYDALERNKELAWAVNRRFLEIQLERGVTRVQFAPGETIQEIANLLGNPMRKREVEWLKKNATRYGYELVEEANAWVRK